MEFGIYNSVEDAILIRDIHSNTFFSINLWCYQICFYKHPIYFFACFCFKGNFLPLSV